MGSQIPLLWGYNLLPQLNEVEAINLNKKRCISMKHLEGYECSKRATVTDS